MNGYYSVFNPDKEKIADCGAERDAIFLINSRNKYWDGHYYQFTPLPGDIVDVNSMKTIEADYEHINDDPHDGWWLMPEYIEVEGQKIATQQSLPENSQEPFIPDFHD